MDWIRRNWPDLLIGIALVAVIAGIIATLLTGGSFFPLGASQASSSRPDSTSPAVVDRGGITSTDTSGRTPVVDTGAASTVSPAPSASAENAAAEAEDEGQEADPGTDEAVSVSALPLPGTTARQPEPQPAAEAAPARAGPQPEAQRPAAQLPSADGAGVYRISVGAFSGEENAERQAKTFRDAGYPVFIGTQGDLSIVLVGPYDDLAEAERVANRIRSGGFRIEPVIYRFQGDSESERASPPANAGRTAPAPQPTASQATAGRFLQVGAYANRESSLPQRERLEGLGFRVTERVENELVKLLVGPFDGDDMTQARTLLGEQGIDHFPR